MPLPNVTELIQELELPNRVELFDITYQGNTERLTNGAKVVGESLVPLYWNNNLYVPVAISISGIGFTEDNLTQKPKVALSNVAGIYSSLFPSIPNLKGASLTYRDTFDTYVGATAGESSAIFISQHTFTFSKLVSKNEIQIIYELDSPLSFGNITLPRRQILREGQVNARFEGAGISKQR